MPKTVFTENAPAPIGPYVQGVRAGNTVYVSGQLGFKPGTGDLFESVEEQAHQAMKNLLAIIASEGMTADNLCKVTIFLDDLQNFNTVNDIYGTYFTGDFPARSCFQVAALPRGAKIEIEAIASLD